MVMLKDGISKENIDVLFSHPDIRALADDNRPMQYVDHPLFNYISVFIKNKFVGAIAVIDLLSIEKEVHYWVFKSAVFYSREIIRLGINKIFSDMKIIRLTAWVREDLKKALNCYKKCGFMIEGEKRNASFLNGEPMSMFLIGLTRCEWFSRV